MNNAKRPSADERDALKALLPKVEIAWLKGAIEVALAESEEERAAPDEEVKALSVITLQGSAAYQPRFATTRDKLADALEAMQRQGDAAAEIVACRAEARYGQLPKERGERAWAALHAAQARMHGLASECNAIVMIVLVTWKTIYDVSLDHIIDAGDDMGVFVVEERPA